MFCQLPHLQCLALTIFSLDFQSGAEGIVLSSLISLEVAFGCDAYGRQRGPASPRFLFILKLQFIVLHTGGGGAEFEILVRSLV